MLQPFTILIYYYRSVQLINSLCQEINGKLLRLAAVLPDAATLSPLDYETNKRADLRVLKNLTDHAKLLKVCGGYC